MNFATCHPDRPIQGNGLCKTCYKRKWKHENRTKVNASHRRGVLRRWALTGSKLPRFAICHPTERYVAKGLCRQCYSKQQRQKHKEKYTLRARLWREANREKQLRGIRNCYYKKNYNITLLEYEELLRKQNYVCEICGEPEPCKTKNLSVDHNHSTGEVRGLLCTNCNSAIGRLKEDPTLFQRSLEYLEKYKKSS
jgi:hypothetical protein